jgi:drug/metabolite transporter (DMT)-like permease
MNLRNFCELVLLSAIWGSSFLFLRIASPAFGPIFLIEMRVLSGLLVLLPVFFVMGKYQEFKSHWKMILLVSLLNMAIPFCFFAYSALNMGAGLLSIMNATVPIFTAMVGFLYFRQRLSQLGFAGLVVGLLGVAILMSDSRAESGITSDLAIPAALFASILYGIAINLAAHKLQGVSGITITTGSLFFSSTILLPLAISSRPEVIPEGVIWLSVLSLGIVCTGFGYVLFYKLIGEIGSQRAITTTYLIPLFSIFWGSLFLGETLTVAMFLGGVTVLLGVALTTGRSSQIANE